MDEIIGQFKALGDKTRLKILCLLTRAKNELCVCEIMDSIEDSHCNISRHLKILKTAGLVKEKKHGKWAYFGLVSPKSVFHRNLLNAVASVPDENFSGDIARLNLRLSIRENDKCVDGLKSIKWAQILDSRNRSQKKKLRRNDS
jgi:ArsR family transcriptional regulator